MPSSKLKWNVIANFGGKAYSGVLQLAFVPIYIKLLGIESYGLIGFFVMLQSVLGVLDIGLSTTLTRELALKSTSKSNQDSRSLVRTMECIYWLIAFLIAISISALSPWIAKHWLNSSSLPINSIVYAITLMGLAIAAQWPYSLYSGGLNGLQKQILLNTTRAIMATVQAVGTILALTIFSPTIETFFTWQIGILGVQTGVTGYLLHSLLPSQTTDNPKTHELFSLKLLKQSWQFSAGLAGISVVSIILTQIDKLILSKQLPLEQFGLYMLTFSLGSALTFLVSPISTAVFPKLSNLLAERKIEELQALYHKSCQAVALFVFPVGVLFALFSQDILTLWTRDPSLANDGYVLLSIVVVGSILNAAVSMPYMLQLAYGWTSLSFYKNVTATVLLIPTLYFLSSNFGALGGAITWALLNIGYVTIEIPLMHRRIFTKEISKWYIVDFGFPLATCLTVGLLFKFVPEIDSSQIWKIAKICLAYIGMLVATAFVLPISRSYFKEV